MSGMQRLVSCQHVQIPDLQTLSAATLTLPLHLQSSTPTKPRKNLESISSTLQIPWTYPWKARKTSSKMYRNCQKIFHLKLTCSSHFNASSPSDSNGKVNAATRRGRQKRRRTMSCKTLQGASCSTMWNTSVSVGQWMPMVYDLWCFHPYKNGGT